AWAAVRPDRALVLPLCGAWSLFSVLHLGWHATHQGLATAGQAAQQLLALAVVLAVPTFVAVLARRASPAGHTTFTAE
ncbi:MAG: hypothetical protein AAGC46_02260, partial [Solirubrobacteraceae bacterium]